MAPDQCWSAAAAAYYKAVCVPELRKSKHNLNFLHAKSANISLARSTDSWNIMEYVCMYVDDGAFVSPACLLSSAHTA